MTEIKIDSTAPVIVLDVELRGAHKITTKQMALDTGATYVIIPWDVAELLDLKPEKTREKTQMITASGVETAPVVTLASVSTLGKKAEDVKAVVHDLPQKSYVDGLLGLSYLKNFNVYIRFRDGVLSIE